MLKYAVSGLPAATAATVDHAIAGLWNSTVKRVGVTEIHVFNTTAVITQARITRTTARGTAGSSITPTIVNDFDGAKAPDSAVIMDLAAYSVQPTLSALRLHTAHIPAAIGAGYVWVFPEPLWVPEGNGLCLTTGIAAATAATAVTFVWVE